MQKIPTLFVRSEEVRSLVTDVVTPGCEWVLAGEGVATRKYDGMACAIIEGQLYKRFEAKDEQLAKKPAPEGAIHVNHDVTTGKHIFWVPVGDGPDDRYFREALDNARSLETFICDGTYELLGPKVQGNPEHVQEHYLQSHLSAEQFPDVPRMYEALKAWLYGKDIEGIVFHHPDGRMAKIKLRDFGLKRTP